MQPTLEIASSDLDRFNRSIEKFAAESNRSFGDVIRQQAKLLVKDLIRATPPFGRNTFSESFNAQRRAGMDAVERDIRKVFVPLRVFVERTNSPKLAAALSSAGGLVAVNRVSRKQGVKRSGVDMQALEAIFRNIGMDGVIIREVKPELHEEARNSKGRVGKRPRSYIVVDERSINRYIKLKQSHIGKAKAGWMKAAIGLAVAGIPGWIREHLTAGVFVDKSKGIIDQTITIGNLVSYSSDFSEAPFRAAIENRIRSMRLMLERIASRLTKKYS